MRIARVGLIVLSFLKLVVCQIGQNLLGRKRKERTVERPKQAISLVNSTRGFNASCSLPGASWDPLLNCFDASGQWSPEAQKIIRWHLRCQLKKEFAVQTRAAWNHALSLYADRPHDENISSLHSLQDATRHGQANLLTDSTNIKKQTRKCAVVSNSGVLRGHSHGDAIDNADVVLRFNDAPLKGWEKLVGSKESIRLVNNQFPWRVYKNEIKSYAFDAQALYGLVDEDGGDVERLEELREQYRTTSIQLLSPGLLKLVEKFLQETYDGNWFSDDAVSFSPTTGAIGMLSAMARCDEVRAYGMAATPAAQEQPYHYYSEDDSYLASVQKADENRWHKSFKAEKDLWRRVAQNPLSDIDKTDVAVIPGFSQITCD